MPTLPPSLSLQWGPLPPRLCLNFDNTIGKNPQKLVPTNLSRLVSSDCQTQPMISSHRTNQCLSNSPFTCHLAMCLKVLEITYLKNLVHLQGLTQGPCSLRSSSKTWVFWLITRIHTYHSSTASFCKLLQGNTPSFFLKKKKI